MAVCNEIAWGSTVGLRLDAEYYQPEYLRLVAQLVRAGAVRLGTIADITDGIHGSPEWVDDRGVTYLSAKCVKDNCIALGDAGQISAAQDSANPRTRARIDDVLITTVGTIGNSAVVCPAVLPANMDRHLGIVRLHPGIDPYYLSTFLNSRYGRFQTLREATGNVQLNLFIDKMKTLLIPVGSEYDETAHTTRLAYAHRDRSEALYEEAEALLTVELGLDAVDLSHQLTYERSFDEVQGAGRFDADYFHPEKQHILKQLGAVPGKAVSRYFDEVMEIVNPSAENAGEQVYCYDLSDALGYFLTEDAETMNVADLGSTKKRFRAGDVVVSRLRSYLGEIALVEVKPESKCVGSTEFIVLRPKSEAVTSEFLITYLRSAPVQKVLKWCQDGSNHPRFKQKEILDLPLPDHILRVADKVTELVRSGIKAHRESIGLLDEAKHRVEDLIEAAAGV